MMKFPTRDEFANHLDTEFEMLLSPEESVMVTLIKVDEATETSSGVSFSVVFLVTDEVEIAQQIFTVKHSKLGEIEVFLSPFWKDETGLKLEAAFNL